ncbi:hypothetical protein CBW58_18235 [Yersinia frederiksenii]|nr:hypothetical protein CBW58_18235 [Yersinia frederiksenii]
MLTNSSLAATSANGITCMPSFLPAGAYINRLRKLPGPLDSFKALRKASISSCLWAASFIYRINPA